MHREKNVAAGMHQPFHVEPRVVRCGRNLHISGSRGFPLADHTNAIDEVCEFSVVCTAPTDIWIWAIYTHLARHIEEIFERWRWKSLSEQKTAHTTHGAPMPFGRLRVQCLYAR